MANSFAVQLADALEASWPAIARPNQLPPPGDWQVWLLLAGRGFGKTRTLAEWVCQQAGSGQAGRTALVAATAADARDVLVEGQSGILAVSPPWFRPVYEPSKRRLTWPNGAMATTFSAEEPERLRGPQHDAAVCDELGAWSRPETWDMLLGRYPRCLVATTPRPTKLIRELLAREGRNVTVTRGSTYENRVNLAPGFFDQIIRKYEGTRLGRRNSMPNSLTICQAHCGAALASKSCAGQSTRAFPISSVSSSQSTQPRHRARTPMKPASSLPGRMLAAAVMCWPTVQAIIHLPNGRRPQ